MNGYEAYFKKKKELTKKKSFRKRAYQLWMIVTTTALAGGSVWYLLLGGEQQAAQLGEQAAHILSKVEVTWLGQANAAETAGDSAKSDKSVKADQAGKIADQPAKAEAKSAGDAGPDGAIKKAQPKTWTDEEVALFTKLEDRKKQLDAREESLKKLEEELQSQKSELERRLASLEEVREKIATKLEDKVKVDQQKVESLVGVYAKMKPVQAAKVIEGINEDLAVEVLAKMKSSAAAEILNLMDADKAKKLSEKFAGIREPASTASAATTSTN